MMKYKNNNLIVSLAGLLALFVFVALPQAASAKVVGGGGQYFLISEAPVVSNSAPVQTTPTVTTQGVKTNTNQGTNTNQSGQVQGASDSRLGANAISSGSSFMPDTFLEWVFLFILILLGVKLWRNATITDKEKHAPLKHA